MCMKSSRTIGSFVGMGSEVIPESLYEIRTGLFLDDTIEIVESCRESRNRYMVDHIRMNQCLVILESCKYLRFHLIQFKYVLEILMREECLHEKVQYPSSDDASSLPDSRNFGEINVPILFF